MPAPVAEHRVVFLFDVDNTLLDNDHVADDLRHHLNHEFGTACGNRYWQIFEQLRAELGYADYLGALQRYRVENEHETRLLRMSSFLIDYPFANRLYPQALDAIERCRRFGPAVILSDGDVVFQPRKIERSGLWEAFHGHVLIYLHKEHELAQVEKHYPAQHYVMVDDKLRILAAMKQIWGDRLTTVFPRQGHYAHDPKLTATYHSADITVERIGELADVDWPHHVPSLPGPSHSRELEN
jgi:FMN phosphatase YigB (HAD superfamily)